MQCHNISALNLHLFEGVIVGNSRKHCSQQQKSFPTSHLISIMLVYPLQLLVTENCRSARRGLKSACITSTGIFPLFCFWTVPSRCPMHSFEFLRSIKHPFLNQLSLRLLLPHLTLLNPNLQSLKLSNHFAILKIFVFFCMGQLRRVGG